MKTTELVAKAEAELQAHKDRIAARHENARRIGDDDACHLGISAVCESITLRELELKVKVAKKGGMWEFDALEKDGQIVNAKLIKGRFGMCWAMCDEQGKFTGEFFGDSRGPRSKLSKAGYKVVKTLKPARVILAGDGNGLAGLSSVHPVVIEDEA